MRVKKIGTQVVAALVAPKHWHACIKRGVWLQMHWLDEFCQYMPMLATTGTVKGTQERVSIQFALKGRVGGQGDRHLHCRACAAHVRSVPLFRANGMLEGLIMWRSMHVNVPRRLEVTDNTGHYLCLLWEPTAGLMA